MDSWTIRFSIRLKRLCYIRTKQQILALQYHLSIYSAL